MTLATVYLLQLQATSYCTGSLVVGTYYTVDQAMALIDGEDALAKCKVLDSLVEDGLLRVSSRVIGSNSPV